MTPTPDWQTQCKVEVYPPYPKGGQHVGITSSGVKITHEPTGLVAIANCARSQHFNRQIAFDMIEGGLTHPRTGR